MFYNLIIKLIDLSIVARFVAVKSNALRNTTQSPNKYFLSTHVPHHDLNSRILAVNRTVEMFTLMELRTTRGEG